MKFIKNSEVSMLRKRNLFENSQIEVYLQFDELVFKGVDGELKIGRDGKAEGVWRKRGEYKVAFADKAIAFLRDILKGQEAKDVIISKYGFFIEYENCSIDYNEFHKITIVDGQGFRMHFGRRYAEIEFTDVVVKFIDENAPQHAGKIGLELGRDIVVKVIDDVLG